MISVCLFLQFPGENPFVVALAAAGMMNINNPEHYFRALHGHIQHPLFQRFCHVAINQR